jgi:hypothetical protein
LADLEVGRAAMTSSIRGHITEIYYVGMFKGEEITRKNPVVKIKAKSGQTKMVWAREVISI